MLTARKIADGSITIAYNKQDVLNIDNVSDDKTINLFLSAIDGTILETDIWDDIEKPWTHEVLVAVKE